MTVYLVTDGWTDLYGIFKTHEEAQAWIDRQKALKYMFWESLQIEEMVLGEARDLGRL